MKYFLFVFLFLSLLACQKSNGLINKVSELQATIEKQAKELKSLRNPPKRKLIHLVYFDLKDSTQASVLIEEINKLRGIAVVKDLEVGIFKDLEDKRAMSELEVIMQMAFDSEEDYKDYQNHDIHLSLKEAAKGLLNAPPVTYDYWVK